MTDYSNGKIYKLVSTKTDEVYVGSCVIKLSARLAIHKSPTNSCVSKKMFANGAIITICLIEAYPCKSKNELKSRELFYITSMACINKNKPFVTELKYADEGYSHAYYEGNLEAIKSRHTAYREDHFGEYVAYQEEYRASHPDYYKDWLVAHPDKRKEYNAKAYAKRKNAKLLALANTAPIAVEHSVDL